jgi:hypothetical protein
MQTALGLATLVDRVDDVALARVRVEAVAAQRDRQPSRNQSWTLVDAHVNIAIASAASRDNRDTG